MAPLPYRVDIHDYSDALLDRLIDLGALDVERSGENRVAALMPDHVSVQRLSAFTGVSDVHVSPAEGRDAESVWVLSPRPVQIGRIRIASSDAPAEHGTVRLVDAKAFGTGLHPTTALCVEAIDEIVDASPPQSVLDVGTGSGVLALAALILGVPRSLGIDIDSDALQVAAENARINGMSERLELAHGGPDRLTGTWPLVLANVLAAPLIEMAPALTRCIAHHGHLVLSGIPSSVEGEIRSVYRRLGMHRVSVKSCGGWVALVFRASW